MLFLHLRATRRKSSCCKSKLAAHFNPAAFWGCSTIMGTKNGSVLVMRGILMLQGIVGMCCSGSRLCAASHHQPDTEMRDGLQHLGSIAWEGVMDFEEMTS